MALSVDVLPAMIVLGEAFKVHVGAPVPTAVGLHDIVVVRPDVIAVKETHDGSLYVALSERGFGLQAIEKEEPCVLGDKVLQLGSE